jgi:hypothetical protein
MSSVIEDDNEQMEYPHPRSDGPRRRRAFTVPENLAHLNAYEVACEQGEGGGYLRRKGLYSSLISEWRKQRDAAVLASKSRARRSASSPPSRPRSLGSRGKTPA